jgi:hypothetical protein
MKNIIFSFREIDKYKEIFFEISIFVLKKFLMNFPKISLKARGK